VSEASEASTKGPIEPGAAAPADKPLALASMLLRTALGMLAGLCFAAGVAWWKDIRPGDVLRDLAAVPLWVVALCLASGFVNLALQSWRWHEVMGPLLGLRYADAYRAQVVGYMFNAILPARGGDLLRVQYLGRRTGKSRATILGTEIVDRWLDFWGWVPVLLILSFVYDLPPLAFSAIAVMGSVLVGFGLAMVLLTRRGYEPRPGSRFGPIYQSLQSGIVAFRSPRVRRIAVTVAPLPWLWEATVILLATRGFGIHLDLGMAYCVLVGFNLAMVVPSPGGIGTVEAGAMGVFAIFHAEPGKALAFISLYHLCQLIPGIIAGVAILVFQGEQLFSRGAAEAVAQGPASSPAEPPAG
jgi:hypothetical protein